MRRYLDLLFGPAGALVCMGIFLICAILAIWGKTFGYAQITTIGLLVMLGCLAVAVAGVFWGGWQVVLDEWAEFKERRKE